jgi:hypothetical protein
MRWFVVADGAYPGSMPLFDDKVRTDSRLGRRTESIFGFSTESTGLSSQWCET